MKTSPIHAVIGAGYGDEGKGLLTDALAARYGADAIVIRANGGAQAGHTVTTPDDDDQAGLRHVFHHVGSGSFVGAATGLSRHFISNPWLLAEELGELAALGVHPRITADARGLLTTPWDMMVNQFIEQARGITRHGSCGLGVGETVERSLHSAYATTLADLSGDVDGLRARFDDIRREWVPRRLTKLGFARAWLDNRAAILSDETMERALSGAIGMLEHVDVVPKLELPADAPIIFEGAQGLMLDQTFGAFPYVTRSNTGLKNIAEVLAENGRREIEVTYAARAYVTRHGAGPLAHEQAGPPSARFEDRTNVPNEWQGSLRFGLLDLDVLSDAIRADLNSVEGQGLTIQPQLAVTCLDHVADGVDWVSNGTVTRSGPEPLISWMGDKLGIAVAAASFGQTRNDIRRLAVAPTM